MKEKTMIPDIRILKVSLDNRAIGTLTRLSGDKTLFAFNEDYIKNPTRPILSMSFRDAFGGLITDVNITRSRLPPFFSNLLPEGPLREYLAQRANMNPKHEFFLLLVLGQDLPGAVTIQAMDGDEIPFIPD